MKKKHYINKRTKMVMFVFMLAALLLFGPSIVSAYTVEIRNNTNARVSVTLYVSYLFWQKSFGTVTIEPWQSYTFHTGARCPGLLEGWANPPDGAGAEIPKAGCAGLTEGKTVGGTCCWNLKFEVRYISGIYHFVKV
jgi:hypothetical protein